MANAPSKPTPSETTTPEVKAKKQKTITITLSAELEALLESNAAKVEAAYGFTPTAAQSIATLIKALLA